MNRYEKGKIYRIVDVGYNKCYIGSTCESLSRRLERHRASYRYCMKQTQQKKSTSAFHLFDEFGLDRCKIELIENCPCNSKEQLRQIEGKHIESTDCVNKVVAGRPKQEWWREYYSKNKDKLQAYYKEWKERKKVELKEYKATYYEEHKEEINAKAKLWRETHKETKNEKDKLYREKNKETLRAKEKQPFYCPCGCVVRKAEKARHEKSQKHKNWLKQQQEQPEQEPQIEQ